MTNLTSRMSIVVFLSTLVVGCGSGKDSAAPAPSAPIKSFTLSDEKYDFYGGFKDAEQDLNLNVGLQFIAKKNKDDAGRVISESCAEVYLAGTPKKETETDHDHEVRMKETRAFVTLGNNLIAKFPGNSKIVDAKGNPDPSGQKAFGEDFAEISKSLRCAQNYLDVDGGRKGEPYGKVLNAPGETN